MPVVFIAEAFRPYNYPGMLCVNNGHFIAKFIFDTLKYLVSISNMQQHAVTALIRGYCGNGNVKEARILMNELKERSITEYMAGTHAGLSAAWLGDVNTAFDYLENAYNDRDHILITLKYSPYVPALLRNDSRFQNLLDRIGFPK